MSWLMKPSWNPTDALAGLDMAVVSPIKATRRQCRCGQCRPGLWRGVFATGTGGGGSFLVLPTLALDAQSGQGPFRAEAVDGLEHASPRFLQEIVAIEDQGDRDALAGGQNTEGACVVRDHLHLFAGSALQQRS